MVDPRLLPLDPHKLPPPSEWFAPDAERHLLDKPGFCPSCGASFDLGIVTEYWLADDRVFFSWCGSCSWTGNVIHVERAMIFEQEH